MVKTSQFSVYVTVYLCLCLLGNVVLVVVFLNIHPWSTTPATVSRSHVQEWDMSSGRSLGCADLPSFTNLTVIGSGWTKVVYSGDYSGARVAVKTVHTTGHDMMECTDPPSVCYQHCADKIIKELQLLRVLAHPNMIKVYGECVPGVVYSPGPPVVGGVAAVTELGQPLSVIQVLQMTFDQRLLMARDVGRLLFHLVRSPLGPVLIKDFRREQFVLAEGTLKLSDVDDLKAGDPSCITSAQCSLKHPVTNDVLIILPCNQGVCQGFNSRLNAMQAGQHFLRLLLPYGIPPALEPPVLNMMADLGMGLVDSEAVHYCMEDLVTNYSAGHYLTLHQKDKLQEYTVSEGFTINGSDFSCTKTGPSVCQQSVSSPKEAAWLCSQWPQCVAFLLLHQWTWTGRQMALFKVGLKEIQERRQQILYIRRGQG